MGTGLSLGAALGMGATAQAADFTVTNDLDTGDGSLRKAIADSEAAAGPDRILFQSGLTGSVTSSNTLGITQALEILGPGAGAFTVSGNDADRVINIDTAVGADVLISGLNLIDGHSTSDGGVISSVDADLTIRSSTISGGTAEIGAGVYSNLGTTSIYDSTISDNDATEAGGGVYSLDADLQMMGSTISGNGAPYGAGIHAKNEATFIHSSTISGNTATAFGGGVWADGGTLAIYSSTISGNAASYGGGVTAAGHDPDPGVANSIVANNAANSELDLRDAGDDPFRVAFSLVESPAGGSIIDFIPGSNVLGVDPQLGSLASNGGPTQTQRPALTSPAVDQGTTGSTPTDQRGLPRPFDAPSIANSPVPLMGPAGTDIGALELQASDFAAASSPPPPPPPPQSKKSCKKKKKRKGKAASAAKKCKKKRKKRRR